MPTQPEKVPVLRDDVIRLEHIVSAGKDVASLVAGRSRAELDENMMLRRALIHAIQEIGEAAAKITPATRALCPTIPWAAIVQTRNIVVHVYWGVDLDRTWHAASVSVGELLAVIEPLLERTVPIDQT